MTLGFVVLSHDRPKQLGRLVRRLVSLYQAPIVVHHDFDKSILDVDTFRDLPVRFVRPHVRTAWGSFTVCEALLKALALLYQWRDPEWFVVLSASDYPLVGKERLHGDLVASPFDAHIDRRRITHAALRPGAAAVVGPPFGFDTADYGILAYDRYLAVHIRNVPSVTRRLRLTRRDITLRHPWVTRLRSPFTGGRYCYAGEAWFSGNRKTAHALLTPSPFRTQLSNYYRSRPNVDESFAHTVICNAGLTVSGNARRYIDWSQPLPHPKTLDGSDLSRMLASGCWFARKFAEDDPVLDTLDRMLERG
jgi:hypothetical protein